MIEVGVRVFKVMKFKVRYLKQAFWYKHDYRSHLRVLLAKWPDICAPTFLAQYPFGCIIKSTHLGDVPRAKSWDLGAYTVPWGVI